jgi:hypothetical protein
MNETELSEDQLKVRANLMRSLFLDGAALFSKKLREHNDEKKKFVHNRSFKVQGFDVVSNNQFNATKKLRQLAGNILMAPSLTRDELKETVANITSKLKNI